MKKYLSYSLMALVSAATLPVSQLIVRGFIIKNFSMDAAGYWEGMNRISALYLMFITTSFSVYYLPRLSEIKEKHLLNIQFEETDAEGNSIPNGVTEKYTLEVADFNEDVRNQFIGKKKGDELIIDPTKYLDLAKSFFFRNYIIFQQKKRRKMIKR